MVLWTHSRAIDSTAHYISRGCANSQFAGPAIRRQFTFLEVVLIPNSTEGSNMVQTTSEPYIYVGGEKGGLVRKQEGDGPWEALNNGLPEDLVVVQVAVNPSRPEMVLLGSRKGAYISYDRGDSWRHLDLSEADLEIWSFAFHPGDPDVIYVGAAPARIFRSRDAGTTWDNLPIVIDPAAVCDLGFPTRIIAMTVNPSEPSEMYAGMEVGGMIRSFDGGDSWESINAGMIGDEDRVDIHGVAMSPLEPQTPYMITRLGPWRGHDKGDRWEFIDLKPFSPITHTRDFKLDPHKPGTFYAGVGASVYGEDGALLRSTDTGKTWERVDKGVKPNSTVRCVSLSSSQPAMIYCCTRYGQVFGSHDGGDTWQEHHLPEGVTELRAVAVS